MILVLSSEGSPGTSAEVSASVVEQKQISFRSADSNETVLEWISNESFERIIVLIPAEGINPFALSRTLKHTKGPKLVLAGQLRPYYRYWAERSGCLTAGSIQAALET